MVQPTTFAEIVDAAHELTLDEQETLLDILRRRIAERGRQRILQDAEEALREHERGETKVATPDEIMKDILS